MSDRKPFHIALWDSGTLMLSSITWRKCFFKGRERKGRGCRGKGRGGGGRERKEKGRKERMNKIIKIGIQIGYLRLYCIFYYYFWSSSEKSKYLLSI